MPRENPSGAVFGVITIGALLAAESGSHDSHLETLGSALIATALYWLVHAYSGLLGRRLEGRERLTAGAIWRALSHDWALIRGAAIPLGTLVIAWACGASQVTAVTAALWSAAASLLALELIAGVRAHASPSELVLQGAVGFAMGLAIIALKVVL